MLKKILFLMTHPGSTHQHIVDSLNSDPRIEIFQLDQEYHHPDDLKLLVKNPHKSSNSRSIWGDVLLHNHQFTCQSLLTNCHFIFWDSGFDKDHPEWKAYSDALIYYRLRRSGMIQYFHRATKKLWNPAPGDLPTFFN